MKKLFTLMMLCLSVSATAWADFTESWTSAAPPHSRPIISTFPSGISNPGNNNKVHAVTQVIKVETQGTVSVRLSITAGTLNLLGIDLATANGSVEKSDYTGATSVTFSAVPAGYYVLRYFVYNNTTDNADLTSTTGSLTVTGAVQAPVISNVANLRNDKVYLVKSGRTSASKDVYLLYNSNVSGYLSSNHAEESVNKSLYDGLDNFQFAIYKHTDNKYYFYIPKGNKIVGNSTDNNVAFPLVFVADTDMEIRTTSTVANYPFMLSTNRSGALNAANISGQHGVVNWSGGYGSTGDTGNAFQFIEAGSLSSDIQAQIAGRITYAETYRNAYTLNSNIASSTSDNTLVGNCIYDADAYSTEITALSTALSNFTTASTDANGQALTTAYNALAPYVSRVILENGEIFKIKCTTAERGYLAFYNAQVTYDGSTTFEGSTTLTLAGVTASGYTNVSAGGFPGVNDANVSTTWAMYKYNDKCYLYSTENKKFIKSGNPLTFTEDVAQASPVTLENIDGKAAGWRLKFVGSSNYISFSHGYKLKGGARTYNDASDAGVQHYLIKTGNSVSDADAGPIAYKILSSDIASNLTTVKAYRAKTRNSGVGYYTYSGNINEVDNAITAAEELSASSTASEVETSLANLKAIPAGYTINQPTVDKLYRFKGKTSQRYMKSNGAGNQMTVSASLDDNGPATIFMLTDDNKLLSYDLGLYANETRSIGSAVNNYNTYSFLKSEGGNIGYYTIKSNYSGAQYLWSSTSGTDRNSTYAEGNCDWEIEEATFLPVPIYNDDYKLGTFYSPVPLDRYYNDRERIKFYTGTVTNNYFNLTEFTGNVIPANTAFVTEFVGDEEQDIKENCSYLQIASAPSLTEDQRQQLANNQLAGQFETITTPTITGKTICTMQEISSALTFASYTGTTVKGFRAYLPVDNSTTGGGDSSFRLVFGVPTGIDTIGNQPAQEQTVYDLSGRRVEHAGKGLYIVNGKKVMIK